MVRGRSYQSNPFRLLCNAYSYLYFEHEAEGFPTKEAAIQGLRDELDKFDNDHDYVIKTYLLIRASSQSPFAYHDHVELTRSLIPFIEDNYYWMKTLTVNGDD